MSALRPARPGEAGTIAALTERAYASYIPLLGRRPAPMDDDFTFRIAHGQAHVLERDGRIIALAVIEDRGDHLWIENLAVEPSLHGGGIGRALLAFAEAEARRLGLRELRLLTNERMARNRQIYARAGFTETERREEEGLRRVYMMRRLGP
ncbi:GNAT family N-acetyltransferase [Roseomonas xinghualingensis]|uniref:GNAT family N-acetyltransferase n=1 Tax=Roseomonas xinghualingensis TaxID=2986475 RepID=UPI0021F1DFBE|nr:GNAT family N-acetyltransferase [Roseomonas sp. SXEYE001]MCV4208812.1 GNAT family N-acetyltransferase [Roseomonas sp. SXEYE001]